MPAPSPATILKHAALIRHFAKKWKIPGHTVDDLCQEAWVRILRVLPSYRPEKCSIQTFIGIHSKYAILDLIRDTEGPHARSASRRRKGRTTDLSKCQTFLPTEDMNLQSVEASHDLDIILSTLPLRLRALLIAKLKQKATKDVALRFGVTPCRVRQLYKRAMNLCRAKFPTYMDR